MTKKLTALATLGVAAAIAISWSWSRPWARQNPQSSANGPTQAILSEIEDYKQWRRFPAHAEPVKSEGHGGMWVVGYYNDKAAEKNGADVFPEGSILVKENSPEKGALPRMLTIMAKTSADWYWLKSTPDGKALTENGKPLAGDVKACIGCHSQAENDMVFSKLP